MILPRMLMILVKRYHTLTRTIDVPDNQNIMKQQQNKRLRDEENKINIPPEVVKDKSITKGLLGCVITFNKNHKHTW